MFLLRLVVEIVSISTDVTLSIIYVICHLGLTVVNFNAFNDISALSGVFPKKTGLRWVEMDTLCKTMTTYKYWSHIKTQILKLKITHSQHKILLN
jgi:hypothetical protein